MASGWFSRPAIALHLTLAVVVPTFALLCRWQAERALAGNDLSWAYVFEWPFFAGYAIYMWWRLLHEDDPRAAVDEARPVPMSETGRGRRGGKPTMPAAPTTARKDPILPGPVGAVIHPGPVGADIHPGPVGADIHPGPVGADIHPGPVGADIHPGPVGADIDPNGSSAADDDTNTDADGELAAYNEYLAQLHASDPPKRW